MIRALSERSYLIEIKETLLTAALKFLSPISQATGIVCSPSCSYSRVGLNDATRCTSSSSLKSADEKSVIAYMWEFVL